MPNMQYVGARYVPKFYENSTNPDSCEWEAGVKYESMIVVTYNGDSYTSKKTVPNSVGNPADNPRYWVKTGDFNASLLALQNRVNTLANTVGNEPLETEAQDVTGAINELHDIVGDEELKTEAQDLKGGINEVFDRLEIVAKKENDAIFYFPSLENGIDSNCALMTINGKAVLFDASISENEEIILTFFDELYSKGLFTNIDYIIISHFHRDHVGLLEQILAAYPHNNCVAYIPMSTVGYGDFVNPEAYRAQVITILNNSAVDVVTVNSDMNLEIEGTSCTIELFNSDPTAYEHYYDVSSDNYNNYCMVSLVKIGEHYAMFGGDIEREAQIYITNNKKLPRLFLYCVHHHGRQNNDYIPYLNSIEPIYGVIPDSPSSIIDRKGSICANYCVEHIQPLAVSSQIFVMGNEGGDIIYGKSIGANGVTPSTVEIYVDNSYDGDTHLGSSDKPYVSIDEAIMSIKKERKMRYVIYLVPTNTAYEDAIIHGIDGCPVTIETANYSDTKAVLKGARVEYSKYVRFRNIEFNGLNTYDEKSCIIFIANSNVALSGCDLINPNVSRSGHALHLQTGNVYITGTYVKNYTSLYNCERNGDIICSGNSYDGLQYCYQLFNVNLLICDIDTCTNCDHYIGSSATNGGVSFNVSLPSTVDIAAFKTLVRNNMETAVSNVFKIGGNRYQIIGFNLWCNIIDDLNDAVAPGDYRFNAGAAHAPSEVDSGGGMVHTMWYSTNNQIQYVMFINASVFTIALRKHTSSGWTGWYTLEPTPLV